MDYLGKGEVLTNTDLDRFVNNIWEKEAFRVGYIEKVSSWKSSAHEKVQLMKKFSSWKMGGKQKCYVYNFVQCSYDIAGDYFHVPCNIIQIALKINNIETLWSFLSEMLMV